MKPQLYVAANGLGVWPSNDRGDTLCAEKGASEHPLMAIFDWSTPQQAAIYARVASRRILAAGSMHMSGPPSDGAH